MNPPFLAIKILTICYCRKRTYYEFNFYTRLKFFFFSYPPPKITILRKITFS